MDGANAKFLADPLGFFSRHVVLMNSAFGQAPADIVEMDLVNAENWKRLKDERAGFDKQNWSKKEKVTVVGAREAYYLTPFIRAKESKSAHPIKAYWLNYQQMKIEQLQLGGGATLLFTPTLNGCTFAVGPGGNPLVVHANFQKNSTDGRVIDQEKMDAEINKIMTPSKTLRKADYAVEGTASVNVTVIGINQGQWRFYRQTRTPEHTQGEKAFNRLGDPVEIV